MQILKFSVSTLFIALCFILAFKTNLLRSNSIVDSKFSFHKFQLWLWTLVIVPCVFLVMVNMKSAENILNDTAFTLLGIALTVGVSSEIVVASQQSGKNELPSAYKAGTKNISTLNEEQKSRGFFVDILTDDYDQFSISRLQNFLFTLVYVMVYIYIFYGLKKGFELPIFDDKAYILMGISSAGFVLGKANFK